MDMSHLSALIATADTAFSTRIGFLLGTQGVTSIVTIENPSDVFEVIGEHGINLLIVDDDLPAIDGVGLTFRVRMDPESPDNLLRVFIALNRDSIERTLEAVDAGVHELLLKPFSDLKLFAAMRTCYREPRRFLHLDGYVGPDRRRGMTMGRCRFRRKEDSAIGEPALQAV